MLYEIFISPIEAVMRFGMSATYSLVGDWGLSLLVLSLGVNLALLPVYHWAEKWQQAERRVQNRLQPKLREFRQAFSGEERFIMIQTLYRQEGYHPIYALRNSLGFLVQVPFFIAAYHLLSHYEPLRGVSFFIFKDLSEPDALLWGINLMPFVMTAVNLCSVLVYTQTLSLNDRIQLWLISLLFLVLLYNSPVGLVLYWTSNNIFSFLKNMVYARLNSKQKRENRQVERIISTFQKPLLGTSGSTGSTRTAHQSRRGAIELGRTILQSPYVLALLVGLFPFLFYFSNNWYMTETSKTVFIIGIFSGLIWAILSVFHVMLSWLGRKFFNGKATKFVSRIFIFVSILVMAFLLRGTLSQLMTNEVYPFLIVGLLAGVLAWFSPKIQIRRFNIVFTVLCLWILGNGLYAALGTEINTFQINRSEDNREQAIYDKVKISQKFNVYYIVPDGYPNREALEKIYGINNTAFYSQLESLGFDLYHSALSNYNSTLSSLSASFGMGHHFYRGNIGFNELLYAREFIVSKKNPVVSIFKNNGYQVHFLADIEYLFRRGCFVDVCSPSFFVGRYLRILIPSPIMQKSPLLQKAKGYQSGFRQKTLQHIDRIVADQRPHFTYIHSSHPNHSGGRTRQELTSFRKGFIKRLRKANHQITNITDHILTRDPNALIIINADHGAWGFGAFRREGNDEEVFNGVPDDLIALDQMGVLLAIRWPDGASKFHWNISTNVNLFRHIFAYLSRNEEILETEVPDDSFVMKGREKGPTLIKVVSEGAILEHMVEMD